MVKVKAIFNNNSHDPDRDFFLEVCRTRIPYLAPMPERFLKELYYRSSMCFYEMESKLFSYGSRCRYISIIYNGTVVIDLYDGSELHFLDIMGRGSVLGATFVVNSELWPY